MIFEFGLGCVSGLMLQKSAVPWLIVSLQPRALSPQADLPDITSHVYGFEINESFQHLPRWQCRGAPSCTGQQHSLFGLCVQTGREQRGQMCGFLSEQVVKGNGEVVGVATSLGSGAMEPGDPSLPALWL